MRSDNHPTLNKNMFIKSRFWQIVDLILLVVVLAIGAWAVRGFFDARTSAPAINVAQGTVNVAIDFGNGTKNFSYVNVASSATVFDALKSAAMQENVALDYKTYPGMGILVTKIGDKANGTGKAYWQFWLNGVYSQKSADQTPVKAGDKVEWKFSSSQE